MYKHSDQQETQCLMQKRNRAALRYMSSKNPTPVKTSGGRGLLAAALFAGAAGYAYYSHQSEDNRFYNGDSDPYERTKRNISKTIDSDVKSTSRDAASELDAAGKHIKNSASLAAQAGQDAYYNAKDQSSEIYSNLKQESENLARDVESETNKFLSEHHMKEGDHTPEQVLGHTTTDIYNTGGASYAKHGADEAAFNAANKLKQFKNSASEELEKGKNFIYEEQHKLASHVNHNPLVNEKVSSAQTKPAWETDLEAHAAEHTKDTTGLVYKDTQKMKPVWDEKSKAQRPTAESGPSFWSSLFGKSNTNAGTEKADIIVAKASSSPALPYHNNPDYPFVVEKGKGNPMVNEKRSSKHIQPDWEISLEEHARNVVHDTTTLIEKDSDKVKKSIWDAKKRGESTLSEAQDKSSSTWNKLFGKAEATKEDAQNTWDTAKDKANDVKREASNTWESVKEDAAAEADYLKAKGESNWSAVKGKAEDLKESAQDAVESASNKLKREANNAASSIHQTQSDLQNKGERMKRDAANSFQSEVDRTSGNLNDLHNEFSNNAEKWKNQTEQKAKSWYEKGTEQVKGSFDSVKTAADEDLRWAENKVQDGVETVKQEVSHLFDRNTDTNKVDTTSAYTIRDGRKILLKPARVVVENASHNEK